MKTRIVKELGKNGWHHQSLCKKLPYTDLFSSLYDRKWLKTLSVHVCKLSYMSTSYVVASLQYCFHLLEVQQTPNRLASDVRRTPDGRLTDMRQTSDAETDGRPTSVRGTSDRRPSEVRRTSVRANPETFSIILRGTECGIKNYTT